MARFKLKLVIPEPEPSGPSVRSQMLGASDRDPIDLSVIDLVILDFDDTITEPGAWDRMTDDVRKSKVARIEQFFRNLLDSGKRVCICTSASNASRFAESTSELIDRYDPSREISSYVPIFDALTLLEDPSIPLEMYEPGDMVHAGFSSKNDRLNLILNLYHEEAFKVSHKIDFTLPRRTLFVDDQQAILQNARIAIGCHTRLARLSGSEDVVDLFYRLSLNKPDFLFAGLMDDE